MQQWRAVFVWERQRGRGSFHANLGRFACRLNCSGPLLLGGGPVPREGRADEAGAIYHVFHRGNARQTIFHKPEDCEAFLRVLGGGSSRYIVELWSFTMTPTH